MKTRRDRTADPNLIGSGFALGYRNRRSCQRLLEHSELIGTPADWDLLVHKYRGNPQALKLIANTIRDIFDRDISKFLDTNILVYHRIESTLSEQLNHLSQSEIAFLAYLSH